MEQEKRLRELLREFRSKYPMTIGWRFEQNSKIVLKHLYDDEEILYAFYAQKMIILLISWEQVLLLLLIKD